MRLPQLLPFRVQRLLLLLVLEHNGGVRVVAEERRRKAAGVRRPGQLGRGSKGLPNRLDCQEVHSLGRANQVECVNYRADSAATRVHKLGYTG